MSSSSSLTLFILFFTSTFLYTPSNSFNITTILSQNNDFTTFNKLLTQTQLASTINSRQSITVLALSNDAVSIFSDQPIEEIKKILSYHVILDYYDMKKLKTLSKKTAILTTLFQSSGQAKGQQGFINVTVISNGDVMIGSAVQGSILDSKVVDSVASQPFNISVLHISNYIAIMSPDSQTIYTSNAPLPAQAPNDDDYEYDEPPSPPSPPSSGKGHAPVSAKAAATAKAPSSKANSTSSSASASIINSQLDLAFAVVMSSFWLFMTV